MNWVLKYIVLDDRGKDITNSFFEEKPEDLEEILKKLEELRLKFVEGETNSEEEERNDVHIYKTLRYPPNSTPPTPS